MKEEFNLSSDFKLVFNQKHDYPKGSFEQRYIDHFANGVPLGDMSVFLGARKHFQEFGVYTNATPNKHPSSQWMKFWNTEADRSINGMHTDTDWIPGYLYFYWNYTPIWRVKEISQEEGVNRKRAERVFDFPDIYDSDYFWFHYIEEAEKRGQHCSNIKKRGIGYSFKGGSMMNRNYFLIPGSKSYAIADQKEYLIKDGILTKAWELMDWLDANTAWSKRRLKNSEMHRTSGFQKHLKTGAKVDAGYQSSIIGITLDGDSDKTRGKRGKLVLWEESGNNPALRQAWVVARNSMEEDDVTYGTMIAFGTGGTEGANFAGLEELIRKPLGYNIYNIPNIFDGKVQDKVGFFVPTYLNRRGCTDENGNSDIRKAAGEIESNRVVTRRNMSNNIYLMTVAEHPFTIDEAVLRMESSPFDVGTAKEVISTLKTEEDNPDEYGEFIIEADGKVSWRMDNSNFNPILEFPLDSKDLNTSGCWVVYSKPIRNNGVISNWRYLAGTDPIDFGSEEVSNSNSNSHSLASTFIFDSITSTIVAEYTGRPPKAEQYYEQLWRGIEYFNAELLYENNLKGLFSYFRNKNKLHLLANEPESLRDRSGYKANNRTKGFHATQQVNGHARDLINTWTLSDHIVGQNQVSGQVDIIPKMYTVRSIPLLRELIAWRPKGNFDRVSSFGAVMILMDDRTLHYQSVGNEVADRFKDSKFFSKINRFGGRGSTLNIRDNNEFKRYV